MPKPECVACGDTGFNSRGGPCTPCLANGRTPGRQGRQKLTVVCNPDEAWEYRCGTCHELRFYPKQTKPTACGACHSTDITVGRPGTLPTKETTMADTAEREIHLEERPTTFKQVVGQKEACQQLIALGKSGMPHCLLFTGESGCGKTTLARIVRRKLKCSDFDFHELNCAQNRGIDLVREIQGRVSQAPIDGEARVWLIDECHQLTADAQGAFLKLLEEPPGHVYFILATTNPEKLKKTIRTRCTEVKVRPLTEPEVVGLVQHIAGERDGELEDEVAEKLAEVCEGSARKALVLLQQIIGIAKPEDQINILQKADAKAAAIEIARALMKRASWATIAKIIKEVDEEPESIRWMILGYFSSVALGGGKNAGAAVAIMENFQDNYFDTKKAGLVLSCYNAIADD